MKILIPTSDQYAHLIEPGVTLFNRYCPGHEIIYLGFDRSLCPKLPENARFHSLGEQAAFGQYWTDPLRPFFESFEDEVFAMMMEDVILMSPVDPVPFETLEEKVSSGKVMKGQLDTHLNGEMYPHVDSRFSELKQLSNNRASLHPAIWRTEYFRKFLCPNFTAWHFETIGGRMAKGDGAKIVGLDTYYDSFYTTNVYQRAVPFPRHNCPRPYGTSGHYVNMEDAAYIRSFIDG